MRLFRHYIPINTIFLVTSEFFIILISVLISEIVYNTYHSYGELNYYKFVIIPSMSILIFYIGNIYDGLEMYKIKETLSKLIICYIILLFMISGIDFVSGVNLILAKVYLIFSLISILFIIIFRSSYKILLKIDKFKNRILIIGYSDIVKKIYCEIKKEEFTYNIIGIVCDEIIDKLNININIIGKLADLEKIMNIYRPNTLIIALSERRGNFPIKIIINEKLRGVSVEEITSFYEKITGKILIKNLRPSWIIFADGFRKNNFTTTVKRLYDVFLAIFGLFVSSPLMIIISVFIKIDSFGPVFFKQERVGENGRNFILVKFRTMVADAEKETGPVWSQTVDTRVTKLGKILRRTGMDEIPQLFNVLRGDMSFVGPRPERPHFVTELQQKIPYYTQRLAVRPGITGWAQVRYGYGATLEDAIEKLQYDLYYIKNMSIFLDLLIVLSTIHKVVFARVAVESTKGVSNNKEEEFVEKECQIDSESIYFTVSGSSGRESKEVKIYS